MEIYDMIIPFNIAKRLKKLGYHYPSTSYWEIDTNTPKQRTLPILHIGCPVSDYNDSSWFKVSAPNRAEVLEWFREIHKYYIYIIPRFSGGDGAQYYCHYSIFKEGAREECDINGDGTYEFKEAELSAITEVLDLIEKKTT